MVKLSYLKYLTLMLLLLLPCLLLAQRDEDGNPVFAEDQVGTFKAGIMFGANGSKIDGDGYGPNFRGFNKLGMNAGARVWVVVHKNWQPGMELTFSQKGSYLKGGKTSPCTYRYIADYVQVPIMASYVIDRRVQAYVGVSYGRLIRSKAEDGFNCTEVEETNFKENIVEGVIGGSIYLDVKKHWVADIRYDISFIDVVKGNLSYNGGGGLAFQQNKSIAVRIGYMF